MNLAVGFNWMHGKHWLVVLGQGLGVDLKKDL